MSSPKGVISIKKKQSLLIKPLLGEEYPTAAFGKGIYIYDESGKKYLDGSSGAVTASLGHAVPEIIQVMKEQAEKISFVYRSQFTTEAAEELAEKLNELLNNENNYWSFFVNSGSEAMETAMKIAIQYWQEQGVYSKNKFISRWTSYHGITVGALSMSGHVGRRERFIPLLEEYPSISAPYCYRCPFNQTYPACQLQCANELKTVIRRTGSENIAAFVAEPIIGAAGGVIVPPDGYYERIKEICEENDILFIADEVMTGIGRTGKNFGMNHWNVVADIISLGKGMTAGYTPMAATLVSEKIMEPIVSGSKVIMSGHTFSANPQSSAIACAVLNYMKQYKLVEKSAELGDYLIAKLADVCSPYQIVGDIRGKGLMIGIEFVINTITKTPFSKRIGITNLVVTKAKENGLLVYPASAGYDGGDGDAIIIAPPLTISKQEIEDLVSIFSKTIDQVQQELRLQGQLNPAG